MSELVAGIDIGGTKLLGVLLDPSAPEPVAVERVDTPRGPDALMEAIAALARSLGEPAAVGAGIAGMVDADGVVRTSPNLPDVVDLAVAAGLRDRLGVPVTVDNDATTAAYGEAMVGAARDGDDVLLVTIGTGIGGGLVVDGEVWRGANGYAGEFGHMTVERDGVPCVCGRFGCWERYGSGSALERMARERAVKEPVLLEGVDTVDGEAVVAAARAGVPGAVAVVDALAEWIGFGLANLVAAFDPDTIVLGGGVLSEADLLLDRIRAAYQQHAYGEDHRAGLRIEAAALGPRAGAIGAALLAARLLDG